MAAVQRMDEILSFLKREGVISEHKPCANLDAYLDAFFCFDYNWLLASDPIEAILSSPWVHQTGGKVVPLKDTPTKELYALLEKFAEDLHEENERKYNHPDPRQREEPWKRPRTFLEKLWVKIHQSKKEKWLEKLVKTIDARRRRLAMAESAWLADLGLTYGDL